MHLKDLSHVFKFPMKRRACTYRTRLILSFSSCCFSVGVISSSSSFMTCSVSSVVPLKADNIPSIFSFFSSKRLQGGNKEKTIKVKNNYTY